MTNDRRQLTSIHLWRTSALGVVLLAFFLRLHYLTLFVYHIDEYFTLAAAKLISQSGAPVYPPTGYFYDAGLPFSYLDGLLFRLFGFSEALGRWPAVFFGVLAVATLYVLGERVLRSPGAGLIAALLLAVNVDSVEWGGRARMITLAQWLALLSVLLLWIGLTRPSVRHRLGFAFAFGLTLLTHFSTVVLIPAWFLSAAGLWRMKIITFNRRVLRDGIVFLAVCGLALSSGVIFQPPPTVEIQENGGGLDAKVDELGDKFLQIPSDVGHAWAVYAPYLGQMPNGLVAAMALFGVVISLFRLAKENRKKRDTGAIFLSFLLMTVLGTLALVISPHWQRARYLLMQCLGIFFLLGAHGLREIFELGFQAVGKNPIRRGALAGFVSLALIALFVPPLNAALDTGYIGWDRYDLAFKHARDMMGTGDKVMTMHPPAAWIYLAQDDYYLVQSSAKLIVRPDGSLGDRYTGATWVETADRFNEVVSGSARVWLMVQEFWLFNSYDGYLQQQILWQMDKQWGEGGVWALASRPGTWPLAREIENRVDGEFEGGTRLLGYSANPPVIQPGGTMWLTLFWHGQQIPQGQKVFVQVRDTENNSVAQADHFIYDNKVPSSRWEALLAKDTAIRDGGTLFFPPDLAPGTYRIVVGFYQPDTFARLGVINDQSGESAVSLGEFAVE